MRILIVDDDETIVSFLTELLLKKNYVVDIAKDGEAGWEFVESYQYDLILLDVMLPKLDGISFCRRLRERKNLVLVMLLTGRDTTTDKLIGLDSGADDYVVKPFNVQELAARIRALIRRGSTSVSTILECGDIRLDQNMHEVSYQSQVLKLSRKEYLLVELFIRNQKRVYSSREIVDHLWSFDAEPPNESTIRSHIKNIRRIFKAVKADDFLETVYGQGYRINPNFTLPKTHQNISNKAKNELLDVSLVKIWQDTKHLSFERLIAVEEATSSLLVGIFDQNLCQKAIHNAHKLAGSLGMFGFEQGTIIARKIEIIFESEFKLPSHFTQIHQYKFAQILEPLVRNLRQQLEEYDQKAINLPTIHDLVDEKINAKIIAVDDDPQILMTLKTILEPLGVELTCLDNQDDFWEKLKLIRPDFLILDINMPSGKEGLDLCLAVRQNRDWNWLPILFLTSCNDVEMLQKAFVMGADDYLTKPIVPNDLLIRIINRLQRIRTIRPHI
ncbi:response regulator [Dolichospermum sp. UHCC 0259]|uniref:response regulator n=1 Tax=Dolichospermum sp. UHCC 0259 TaxID=2590010 RepID=UPI001444E3ED|nr:response regulator [Dolichospermum sp. UHCC 0259]MTJ49626.1 response regulator [Dolichospermum sp. UHCC 0259]